MSAITDAMSMGRMQVAVARKQLDAIEQEGKDALKLISAAQPPGQNLQPGVGTQLNVVA
jgi:hypothetical protein